jgi:HipA-like kinase
MISVLAVYRRKPMPVEAIRLIRKMRGGAQAHLLECGDGFFYVVKFRNNPQHRRILINEWIASVFLNYLQISAPAATIVNLSPAFLASHPEIRLQLGTSHLAVEPGWHFGSRYPGDPARVLVYDFLPDLLLDKVVNVNEFAGVLAFDKWMGNSDARQSIFFRARLRQWSPASAAHPARAGFVAHMMDHGYVFNGPHWTFPDSPLQGLYFRPNVYQSVRSLDDFEPWLGRIQHFPEEIVDAALKQLPQEWLAEDSAELESLLAKLMSRRKRVPDLIRESRRGRVNPFPGWRL